MKKQIKLIKTKKDFFIEEKFDEIVDIISPYFVTGGSHVKGVVPEPFSFWVFSRFETCLSCDCSRNQEVLNLQWEESPIPEVFFDWNRGLFCPSDKEIIIKVNEKFAGVYCPVHQIFSLTDWTHSGSCSQIAQKLLPMLLQILLQKGQLKTPPKDRKKPIKFPDVTVTLGADPELEELRDWNKYTPVPTSYRGINPSLEIGADGAGFQIELRPKPAQKAVQLVRNIKQLITRIHRPVSVKGDRYPLGCHIHFGIPGEARVFIPLLVEVLDDFLGRKLIDLSGQARGEYKILGAYEKKPWGFEYRSLPSAVLYNPEVARIVFKIAKNCVEGLLKRGVLEYNSVPTEEDYRKIAKLTSREYEIFEKFIEKYRSYNGLPINTNWVKGANIFNQVVFCDDWLSERKQKVEQLLSGMLKRKKIQGISIKLYGLREDRGLVCAGFRSSVFKEIPHPIEVDNDFVFGLPWQFRMGDENLFDRYVENVVKEIAQAIVAKLQKFKKGKRVSLCRI